MYIVPRTFENNNYIRHDDIKYTLSFIVCALRRRQTNIWYSENNRRTCTRKSYIMVQTTRRKKKRGNVLLLNEKRSRNLICYCRLIKMRTSRLWSAISTTFICILCTCVIMFLFYFADSSCYFSNVCAAFSFSRDIIITLHPEELIIQLT